MGKDKKDKNVKKDKKDKKGKRDKQEKQAKRDTNSRAGSAAAAPRDAAQLPSAAATAPHTDAAPPSAAPLPTAAHGNDTVKRSRAGAAAGAGSGAVATKRRRAASAAGDTAEADAATWHLSDSLRRVLREQNVHTFFPVQRQVVPVVLHAERSADARMGDLCVSAPTGSGKTLAYVLPVVEVLSSRVVPRLRALVMVPTRDLVAQVAAVFTTYTAHTDLTVATASGSRSFQAEQADLAPGAVDICVCTPGRLMDHLDQTPGFSLQHLRFLVVDEADRMLAQSYHNWVKRVYASAFPVGAVTEAHTTDGFYTRRQLPSVGVRVADVEPVVELLRSVDAGGGDDVPATRVTSVLPTPFRRIICSATLTRNPQKLALLSLSNPMHFSSSHGVVGDDDDVASAGAGAGAAPTVTTGAAPGTNSDGSDSDSDGDVPAPSLDLDLDLPSDAVRLAPAVEVPEDAPDLRYRTPASLKESMVICNGEDKAAVLILLLRRFLGKSVVVFTGSVHTTHHVARVLQLYGCCTPDDSPAVEFSSRMPQRVRAEVIDKLRRGEVKIVVSSDAAARGLDIPGLDVVIQYDAAPRAKTYVHRVGRTARAGQAGVSVTMLKPEQVKYFKDMLRRIDNGFVKKETVGRSMVEPMLRRLQQAEAKLKHVVREERRGGQAVHEPVAVLPAGTVPDWATVGVKPPRRRRVKGKKPSGAGKHGGVEGVDG